MVQSAFRNLLDTQFTDSSGKVTTKAFLTYEEVFKQMKMNFCDEEVDIFMAYLITTKFSTREEQIKKAEKEQQKRNHEQRLVMLAEREKSIEDIRKANKIPKGGIKGKPKLWNDPSLSKGLSNIKKKAIE